MLISGSNKKMTRKMLVEKQTIISSTRRSSRESCNI